MELTSALGMLYLLNLCQFASLMAVSARFSHSLFRQEPHRQTDDDSTATLQTMVLGPLLSQGQSLL